MCFLFIFGLNRGFLAELVWTNTALLCRYFAVANHRPLGFGIMTVLSLGVALVVWWAWPEVAELGKTVLRAWPKRKKQP